MGLGMTFKNGRCYHIRFYDHFIGGTEPIECEVFGWITKQDKTHIYLSWWIVDHKDPDIVKDNLEPYGIVKAAIKAKRLVSDTRKLRL